MLPAGHKVKGQIDQLSETNEKLKCPCMEVTLVLGVFLHLLLLQCASEPCDEGGREDSGPSLWCVSGAGMCRGRYSKLFLEPLDLTPPPPSLQVLDTGPSKVCDFSSQPPPHHPGLQESCVSGQRQQGHRRWSVTLTLTCRRLLHPHNLVYLC